MEGIEEQYVSFETDKLLREKGFDDVCRAFIAAPSQSIVMKWLREVHNVFIEINGIWVVDYGYNYSARIIVEGETKKLLRYYNSYEQSCEAAIKYVLENLI